MKNIRQHKLEDPPIGYDPLTIDFVRKSYPQLLAKDIVEVQSMDIQSGSLFTIRLYKTPWYRRWYRKTRFWIRKKLGLVKWHEGCFGGYWD